MALNQRDASRKEWSTWSKESARVEEINSGSLQRIADACELMAKDRAAMEARIKWLEERHEADTLELKTVHRANAALRGCLKRAKKGRAK